MATLLKFSINLFGNDADLAAFYREAFELAEAHNLTGTIQAFGQVPEPYGVGDGLTYRNRIINPDSDLSTSIHIFLNCEPGDPEKKLSTRTLSCLERVRVKTVGDLISWSDRELLTLANFGQMSLDFVRKRLHAVDLDLFI